MKHATHHKLPLRLAVLLGFCSSCTGPVEIKASLPNVGLESMAV